MKHNLFKIRKVNGSDSNVKDTSEAGFPQQSKQETMQRSIQVCQENMNSLMSMFETFMKQSLSTQKENSSYESQTVNKCQLNYEARDRHVIFKVPSIARDDLTQAFIERWTTEVCNAAFSSAFNYYISGEMTFQQTKVFCSQTIIGNIIRLTQKYNLQESHMNIINRHLSDNVLDYLQKKYPLTMASDVNKALDKELETTNNLDQLANDFLYTNGIIFKYRQSGNYNDTIMRVINKAIDIAEDPWNREDPTDKKSAYQYFEQEMTNLFQLLYDEEWVYSYQAKRRTKEEKEKYMEKVKQYTRFMIGRKISENTPQFTEQEITGQNLIIKSPAILRILTKWCEQLWTKFECQSYFSQRAEPVILQNPEYINPFFKWMKTSVDKRLNGQKTKIEDFKKQLSSDCNLQQAETMLKYLQEDDINFVSKYEKTCGKFTTHMVKNLHTYIVLYLNRLIHGLLTVSKEFYQNEVDKSWDDWQSPPNLVTFKIGDLFRCKLASKEREIRRIYQALNNRSVDNPARLKIVRVKNRLREGTNDILLNIRFKDKIICQIQLQVISKSKSKFIQCSNAFSHYIYELKRSIFGPITELCNIWCNFEARAKTFVKLLEAKQKKSVDLSKTVVNPSCTAETGHYYERYDLPFSCSICNLTYFHNNYIFPNKKCNNCRQFICVKCQIRELGNQELKEQIFKDRMKDLRHACTKHTDSKIPSFGVCVKIQSKEITIEVFQYTKVQSKFWLFGRNKDKSIYEIQKVRNPKEIGQFLRSYCIFNLTINSSQFIQITNKQALNFTIRQYLRESYRQNRQSLILTQIRLTTQEMHDLMRNDGGNEQNRLKVKKIEYASNYIDSVSYFECFTNLTDINLDYNKLPSFKAVSAWKKLEKLELKDNSTIDAIGEEIGELEKLLEIRMSNCRISTISENIGKLKNLTLIKLDRNPLVRLPASICELTNLKQLSVLKNNLVELPENVGALVNLKKVHLGHNKLTSLPTSFVNLINLILLTLNNNQLQAIVELKAFTKLQRLELQQNRIEELPQDFISSENLKILNLSKNKLSAFQIDMSKCKDLQTLALHGNTIKKITDTIGACLNLQSFSIFQNQLEEVPAYLPRMKKLSTALNLKSNIFKTLPAFIAEMNWITDLNLQGNRLQQIPPELNKMQGLKHLNLSYNSIKRIPPEFSSFKQLISVNFKSNKLEEIPDFISEFQYFKKNKVAFGNAFSTNQIKVLSAQNIKHMGNEMVLNYNKLQVLPVHLIQDKNLIVSMVFSCNRIKEIPRDIKLFTSLKRLGLQNNLIEIVPAQLKELTKLHSSSISLNENPIKEIQCPEFVMARADYNTKIQLKIIIDKNKPEPVAKAAQPAAKSDSSDN